MKIYIEFWLYVKKADYKQKGNTLIANPKFNLIFSLRPGLAREGLM